jgi:plasmid stabilization system protein ParE
LTLYILSEDADRDLDEIWDYIAEDNIDAADQPGCSLRSTPLATHPA